MKRILPFTITSLFIAVATVLTVQHTAQSNNSGAPAGRTGAPGESTCIGCHSGSALNSGGGTPSITSNIPSGGYVAGNTYTITVSIAQTGISKFGFEASVEQLSSGNHTGTVTITNTNHTKTVSTNYVTHKSAGTSGSGSRSWSFDWTAPCAGTDTIAVYAAFNATNSNGNTAGDKIYATSIKIPENLTNVADSVFMLSSSDIGNSFTGSDLRVSFDTDDCELRTDEYRIMVVKEASAAAFNVTAAGAVASADYRVVATGNPSTTRTTTLAASATDTDGDPIRNHHEYRVFVLCKALAPVTNDLLIKEDTSIILTAPTPEPSNVVTADVGNNGNGLDLEVMFTKPSNEIPLMEYRLFAVKDAQAASFDTAAANALPPTHYVTAMVGTSGSSVTMTFDATSLDSDGDLIKNFEPYHVFVMSKSDGVNTTTDAMAQTSQTITMETNTLTVTDIQAQDIGSNGNGLDLEVSFMTPNEESTISEYRVIAVKAAQAPGFDTSIANALSASQYVVEATGNPASTRVLTFMATSEDSDGDLIVENEDYIIFVMSVSDGVITVDNALAEAQQSVRLGPPAGIALLEANDIVTYRNGNQLMVDLRDSYQGEAMIYTIYGINGQVLATGWFNERLNSISLSQPQQVLILNVMDRAQSAVHTRKLLW